MMKLNQRLYELCEDKARTVEVEILSIGLGYTAVTTSDGGIGLSYTYFDRKESCSVMKHGQDFEGRKAIFLLDLIRDSDTIGRSAALALINALNYDQALALPEDHDNAVMFDAFHIGEGTKVAMVGFFGPLFKMFKDRGANLEIIDMSRKLGDKDNFYTKLTNWADVLFLTSTSILNNTSEDVLSAAANNVKTIMLGPSTPMIPAAFDHLPVHMLAGTVPLDKEGVLKAVRHGLGTPVIHRFSRKSYILPVGNRN